MFACRDDIQVGAYRHQGGRSAAGEDRFGETEAVVGGITLVVAEVLAKVALGVKVDRQHLPPCRRGDPGDVGCKRCLTRSTFSIRDSNRSHEHVGIDRQAQ
jgi:hypothetical protein